jgi:hypothetical protein
LVGILVFFAAGVWYQRRNKDAGKEHDSAFSRA